MSTSATTTVTAPRFDLEQAELAPALVEQLGALRRRLAGDIITCTNISASGHPGGSLSCLDALIMLYASSKVEPKKARDEQRDRIFVSNGHITPGVYSVLCAYGFDDREKFLAHFRQAGSRFGGHVETHVPGVEWNTGNLGQGFSAATASALAAKLRNEPWKSYVLTGDGELQKGQAAEARRFAKKFALDNLCTLVDLNGLQIGGKTSDVMPTPIVEEFRSAGWAVVEVDGHDFAALYRALRSFAKNENAGKPTAIIMRTVMGKGVSFMENDAHFHGTTPSREQAKKAYAELGLEDHIERYVALRHAQPGHLAAPPIVPHFTVPTLVVPEPKTYTEKTDNRSAYGHVLKDLATANNLSGSPKVLGLSCDLEGSVKMTDFKKVNPKAFIEGGIQEHHMAAVAGKLSTEGFVTFFSTFGVFAGAEGYNQERLNDYNDATVKVVATHCGLDVGEDGPTHQSIDYVGLFANTFHFEVFAPCDPNQTDRIIRYVASSNKPAFVAMGRSKLDIVKREDGTPFWSGAQPFVPGGFDVLREGKDGAIIVMGTLTNDALKAHQLLKEQGKNWAVYAVASLKPFSNELVAAAAKCGRIITLEDHHVDTGLGRLVAMSLVDQGLSAKLKRLGVHQYASSGAPADLFKNMGLDAGAVVAAAQKL